MLWFPVAESSLFSSPIEEGFCATNREGPLLKQISPVCTDLPLQGVVADTSPQTVAPSSQDSSGQQQQLAVDTPNEHAPAYSFQQSK